MSYRELAPTEKPTSTGIAKSEKKGQNFQQGDDKFSSLAGVKRDTDPNMESKKANLNDQKPQTSMIGELFNKAVKGNSSGTGDGK